MCGPGTRVESAAPARIASEIGLRVVTQIYPFGQADRALDDLAHDRVRGAAVLDLRR